jgi:putative endonuclease
VAQLDRALASGAKGCGFESHRAHEMYHAYILRSLKDGSYYYGSAEDISGRLKDHNRGKVKYTKGHLPYELHYSEEFPTRREAIVRERFFKSIAGYRWLREKGIIQ